MVRYARLIGELSRAWGGWQPSEIDIGGGFASPRDPHNKEMPRSEFVTTALAYPFLVGLRGIGEKAYHATIGEAPARVDQSSRPEGATLDRGVRTHGHLGADPRACTRRGSQPTACGCSSSPGRAMYGDTGIHLTTVKTVKRQTAPIPYTWVLTDTTVFFLTGGVLEHNRHPFVFVKRAPTHPRNRPPTSSATPATPIRSCSEPASPMCTRET